MSPDDARTSLLEIGRPPAAVLRALREEIKLSDHVLGYVAGRSAQTVRRWRRSGDGAGVPDGSALAIEDLRAIAAMLLRAKFDGPVVKRFLLSRNIGLGQDRPVDGVRAGLDGFRRVEHVTECFIAGSAPEPGPPLVASDAEEAEPASPGRPRIVPSAPHEPVRTGER